MAAKRTNATIEDVKSGVWHLLQAMTSGRMNQVQVERALRGIYKLLSYMSPHVARGGGAVSVLGAIEALGVSEAIKIYGEEDVWEMLSEDLG